MQRFILPLVFLFIPFLSGAIKVTPSVRVESPLYVAWINAEYHCCEQIDYTVRAEDIAPVDGKPRAFTTPKNLRDVCLEAQDYDKSGYDRGHLRALSLSAGNPNWQDVNCMAVIVPQNPHFNRVTFRPVEETISNMATKYGAVDVSIRCLFDKEMKPLAGADEPHRVPSRFLITATSIDAGKQIGHVWLMNNETFEK